MRVQDDRVEFTRPIAVADVGDHGLNLEIQADSAERSRLAERLGVIELKNLTAKVSVCRTKTGQYAVNIDFSAEVLQSCVISLETVTSRIHDRFSECFADDGEVAETEVDIDPVGDDPPGAVIDGRIDVGELVVQYLALAIDPYPRKPGAIVGTGDVQGVTVNAPERDEGQKENPFAALGALRSVADGSEKG